MKGGVRLYFTSHTNTFMKGGDEAGARNLAFFCVKWLRPAMKGTSCAPQVRSVRFGV